jgi:hypothetical protein
MKIYVTHSSAFDYQKELYEPLRDSELNSLHQIVLPHQDSKELFSTAESLKDFNLIIAEVSYPSTGQGIELGWANVSKVPIVCIYKHGTKPSSGLKMICQDFIEYSVPEEIAGKIGNFLQSVQ